MSSDYTIEIENVSKCYQIYDRPQDRLKQMLWRGHRQFYKEFVAVSDISLHIKKGETIGIIGSNGSGKSTLLQMLVGTLAPTGGSITKHGRVGALLELGSGFNGEFTGRENVYMNASVLGLAREEIEAKMQSIQEFADIGDFFDRPVKHYSSGMFVRLAFAVVVHVDAEILVIDEALAVGDAAFVQKCMRFLRQFKKDNTLLFVSHDAGAVTNLCDRVLWLDQGKNKMLGDAKTVCEAYLASVFEKQQGQHKIQKQTSANDAAPVDSDINASSINDEEGPAVTKDQRMAFLNASSLRNDIKLSEFNEESASFGLAGATVQSVALLDKSEAPLSWAVGGEVVALRVSVIAHQPVQGLIIGFFIKDKLGQSLFGDTTDISTMDSPVYLDEGQDMYVDFEFVMPLLQNGDYSICVAVAEGTLEHHVQHHWVHDALLFSVKTTSVRFGIVGIPMNAIRVNVSEYS
ncbi:MAG: ABC transporter ATP-binding protein [Pseudomonadales bacterium]|nr:ABC transporter ATP-binding protein [Pseudomonadales bacterium]